MPAQYGVRVELHTTSRHHELGDLAGGLLDLIAPARCAGCDRYGELLCAECAAAIWVYDSRLACPECSAPYGELVCTTCGGTRFPWSFIHSLGPLEGALARSIVLHKDQNERRVGALLGIALGQAIALAHPEYAAGHAIVTWVPPTAKAIERRGFDHGRSIASGVARALGTQPTATMDHGGAKDSRVLSRAARAKNLRSAFTATSRLAGRVLLVDDVLTTGATATECTQVLMGAGASEVALAVLARTW